MKTVAKRCAALCLGLLSGPVSAADASYTTQYDTCINSSGGGTADMRTCIGEEYKRQDSRLNVAYKKLLPEMSASRRQQLVAAQRLWVHFRDANCKTYLDPDGGTITVLNAASCGLRMTADRAAELEDFPE